MKVLLINGSPRHAGNTFIALSEVAGALEAEGVRTQIVQLGNKPVRGCIACGKCADLGRCVFDDPLYDEVRVALRDADGLVVGSPVYYAGPNGSTGSSTPVRNCWPTNPPQRWSFAAGAERVRRSTG